MFLPYKKRKYSYVQTFLKISLYLIFLGRKLSNRIYKALLHELGGVEHKE